VARQILQEPVDVIGSGRTDAGVHALAQVAHLRTRSSLVCERFQRSLNSLLPPDIAILKVEEARGDFHARFLAVRKRYRYRMFTGQVVSPFIHPYVHRVSAPLRLSAMRQEAAMLRGRHDFLAFTRARSAPRSTVRTVTEVNLRRRGDEIHFEIEGNGFLHTMVRGIVGTLLEIGRGRLPQGTVRRMLSTKQRSLGGATLPAKGLTLVSVEY
jgi:tRNA pseudouridine38-40 synthase